MLNLISTPIGNLDDISLRAIDVIKSSDYIYAEDTRSFKNILRSIKCEKSCKSFHEHNEDIVLNEIVEHVLNKKNVVLACEAGTPAISDPGFKLIRKFVELKLDYTLIPGPSSVINALVLSGLPTDQFSFYGFVPRKKIYKVSHLRGLQLMLRQAFSLNQPRDLKLLLKIYQTILKRVEKFLYVER
tara:strand:+ start:61 stop:618 length:558 start_codon:yes stop_codon:yes gene_type:complete